MAIYQNKLIISGKKVELYQYEKPIHAGKQKKNKKKAKRRSKEEIIKEVEENENKAFQVEVMRDYSLRRTRSRIVRLIDSNTDLKVFITLTFKENVKELGEANLIFKKFIQRLKRRKKDLKYLAVPEFQKRGAVHYHILVNFEMATSELETLWQNGFVKINRVQHINHMGLYISKYIGKNLFDIRYFGMRKILASRNLEQPVIVTVFKEVKEYFINILSHLKPNFEKKYRSDWLGIVQYSMFSQ